MRWGLFLLASVAAATKPLILTGMDPEQARAASKVTGAGLDNGTVSYAGFFTTQQATDNNMFFWYFQAQNGDPNAPLLIWLQGGPGGSSMFALFSEMGPYSLVPDGKGSFQPVRKEITWNDQYGMLFIDNPVGAGFSYTSMDSGYCTDSKKCVAQNLYSLLQQFYTVFTDQQKVPLYITGESYGGHYVPAIGAFIHRQNQNLPPHEIRIPLGGVAIGDGWVDPVNMVNAYPDLMFNTGLIDVNQKKIIQGMCQQTTNYIKAGQMMEAFDVWDKMLNGDVFPYPNLFHNMTGLNDYDNYLNTNPPESFEYYAPFLNLPAVQDALHVGSRKFPSNPTQCELHLLADFMVSFQEEITVLMDNYKVLLYSGQLDVIIGPALTEAFLYLVPWKGQARLANATRSVWRINPSDVEVAGYATAVDNFTYVIIRKAGHIAPFDQPAPCRDMIQRFVHSLPYPNLPDPKPSPSTQEKRKSKLSK